MSNWYQLLARYLGAIPDNYLVFDTETQGLNVESPATLITQLGYALVVRRRCVQSKSFMLDWTRGPVAIPVDLYRQQLETTGAAMTAKGKVYHTTFDKVSSEGVEPIEGLGVFRSLIEDAQAHGFATVAHNGYAFDRPLIEHHFRRYLTPLAFNVENMLDTGLFEKSRKMGHAPPNLGQCLRADWYSETSRAFAKGVKWSLDGACADEYRLFERHGGDPNLAHSAGFDAEICHHLLEAMRERACCETSPVCA